MDERYLNYYVNASSIGCDLYKWHFLTINLLSKIIRPEHYIADIGCGGGQLLKKIVKRHKIQAIGYDISKKNIENCHKLGLDAKILDFNTDPWSIKSSLFDIVISNEVIEHLIDPRYYLKEIFRILKPSGYLVITTPNAFNIMRRLAFLLGHHHDPSMDPSRISFAEHIRAFSFNMLERMLKKEGFKVLYRTGDRIPFINAPKCCYSLISSHICYIAYKS